MKNVGFTQSEFLTQIWHSRPFRYTKSERKICEKLSVFNILMDKALPSEGRGQRFESSRVRHLLLTYWLIIAELQKPDYRISVWAFCFYHRRFWQTPPNRFYVKQPSTFVFQDTEHDGVCIQLRQVCANQDIYHLVTCRNRSHICWQRGGLMS